MDSQDVRVFWRLVPERENAMVVDCTNAIVPPTGMTIAWNWTKDAGEVLVFRTGDTLSVGGRNASLYRTNRQRDGSRPSGGDSFYDLRDLKDRGEQQLVDYRVAMALAQNDSIACQRWFESATDVCIWSVGFEDGAGRHFIPVLMGHNGSVILAMRDIARMSFGVDSPALVLDPILRW